MSRKIVVLALLVLLAVMVCNCAEGGSFVDGDPVIEKINSTAPSGHFKLKVGDGMNIADVLDAAAEYGANGGK